MKVEAPLEAQREASGEAAGSMEAKREAGGECVGSQQAWLWGAGRRRGRGPRQQCRTSDQAAGCQEFRMWSVIFLKGSTL